MASMRFSLNVEINKLFCNHKLKTNNKKGKYMFKHKQTKKKIKSKLKMIYLGVELLEVFGVPSMLDCFSIEGFDHCSSSSCFAFLSSK